MANDTLERWTTEETNEQPEVYTAVAVNSGVDEDLACARCVGECKVF